VPRERFEELSERLLRAGIAPRHVRRYVAELSDHFDDLVREGAQTGLFEDASELVARTRIGSDDELAAVMLARPELRSVAARLPWLVFGLSPILMLVVAIAAAVVIEAGLVELHLAFIRDANGQHPLPPDWMRVSTAAWNWMVMYVAPLLVAYAICVVGLKQRSSFYWIAAGAGVVCMLGGFHVVNLTWSELPMKSELSVSLALAPPFPRQMLIVGILRAAINVVLTGLGYWLWLRRDAYVIRRA
jgi:hypothetical protein